MKLLLDFLYHLTSSIVNLLGRLNPWLLKILGFWIPGFALFSGSLVYISQLIQYFLRLSVGGAGREFIEYNSHYLSIILWYIDIRVLTASLTVVVSVMITAYGIKALRWIWELIPLN